MLAGCSEHSFSATLSKANSSTVAFSPFGFEVVDAQLQAPIGQGRCGSACGGCGADNVAIGPHDQACLPMESVDHVQLVPGGVIDLGVARGDGELAIGCGQLELDRAIAGDVHAHRAVEIQEPAIFVGAVFLQRQPDGELVQLVEVLVVLVEKTTSLSPSRWKPLPFRPSTMFELSASAKLTPLVLSPASKST